MKYRIKAYGIREKNFREIWGMATMYLIFYGKYEAENYLKMMKKERFKNNPKLYTKNKLEKLEIIEVIVETELSPQLLRKEKRILKNIKHE